MRRPTRRSVSKALAGGGLAALSGCLGLFGGSGTVTGGPDTETGARATAATTESTAASLPFPPGTARTGVVDAAALVEAHLLTLEATAYRFGFTAGTPWNRTSVTGRQEDGVGGPRLFRVRSRAIQERTDPDYVVERRTRTDRWHGPEMPVDLEYDRTVESTSVSDRSAYETAAPDFEPGETTSFERLETNSLVSKQRSTLLSQYLGPLTFGNPTGRSVGGSNAVRFEVTGGDEGTDTEGIELSGALVVEPNGRVADARRNLHRPATNEAAGLQFQTRGVGSTRVSGPPAWVRREFGDG
jgi:hypothetical protein